MSTAKASKSYLELFTLSIISLWVELLVVRWMSLDIRAFAVFRTFPLVTCFIGLGAGFAIYENKRLFQLAPLCLLLFVLLMKIAELTGINLLYFPSTTVYFWNNFALAPSLDYVVFSVASLFVLLAPALAVCLCIGTRLGQLFAESKPLNAYLVNLLGALTGSLLFATASFLGVQPCWLALIAGVFIVGLLPRKQILLQMIPLLGILLLAFTQLHPETAKSVATLGLKECQSGDGVTYWSPYQRIDTYLYATPPDKQQARDFLGMSLGANHAFYQFFFNPRVDKTRLPGHLVEVIDDRQRQYTFPYRLGPAKEVLVVGAGLGQNVSAAFPNQNVQIDAVEIDPLILELGKKYNQDYKCRQVKLICDDARHFFRHATRKYDLIIFSLLDSQSVVGQGSSVRVDSYVYTKESIQEALNLLQPDGLIVIAFAAIPGIADRLNRTLESAASYSPLVLKDVRSKFWATDTFFVLGDAVRRHTLAVPAGWLPKSLRRFPNGRVLTDDWPYLYVSPDAVDLPYLSVVFIIVLISLFAGRRVLLKAVRPADWQMFFLGAAFLLLELHAISLLSLVYGSTWLTSAIVINGILIMIISSNLIVLKAGDVISKRLPLVYIALFLAILASYCLPTGVILSFMAGLGGPTAVMVVTLLPLALAGIVFSSQFSKSNDAARALAFNLFGSVIGGLTEYLSNFWGIKSLELVGLGFYAAAFACFLLCSRSDTGKDPNSPAEQT